MFPPEGILRAVTAVVETDSRGATAIRLLDPTVHETVPSPEGPISLRADFTAPYAVLLSRTRFARGALLTALRYERAASHESGIYLLEPYDPNKIPLLMVHGLVSSPLAWRELTNAVLGDATLRSRYQVWHAVYPTGIPYLHAAADFRDKLTAMREQLDPELDDFATGQLVVVAHSKGGLLSRTLVSNSGEHLWNAAFTVPPEALDADEADRAAMLRILRFEHEPAVRRVVFLATPHRGSAVSENPLARAAAWFVALPRESVATFERVLRRNADRIAQGFRLRRETGLPSGPRALSDQDPLIRVLAELPIEVPFHTILGQASDAPTDGVVTHESSTLEGAASTLIVPGTGHDVHQSRPAIAEVKRILRQHLLTQVP